MRGAARRVVKTAVMVVCAVALLAGVAAREGAAEDAGGVQARGVDLNERLRAMSGAVRFSQDYLLGSGDVIQVTVYGIEELKGKELELDASGEVALPFVGAVGLSGLTAREAEAKVATLYEASVLKDPQVGVSVKERRSQFVNVLGAVKNPGTYQLARRVFLLDALTMAGGLVTEKSEPRAYVHRAGGAGAAGSPDVAAETVEVDLSDLLEKGDMRLNVPVYAGDVVSVPERVERFFYVLGDVNKGGAFAMKRGEAVTLTKALATAGGLMVTAKSKKSYVIRRSKDGAAEQIAVDVGKVLKGEAPDMELADSDVVFVPGSTTKTISKGVMGSIGSVMSALTYVALRGY